MSVLLRPVARVWFVVAWSAVACSPRALPDRVPTSSALSVEASESPAPVAAVALREDPPLPGEATSAWQGLAPAATGAPDPHAHHHGAMHGGGVTAPSSADAGAQAPSPHEGHDHAH